MSLSFTGRLWCSSCSNRAPAVVFTIHQEGLPLRYWVIDHNCCFLNSIHHKSLIQLLVILFLLTILRIDVFVHLTGLFQEEWCSSYEHKGAFWVCCGSILGWGSNRWVSWKGTFPLIALVDNDLCCHGSSFERLLNLQLGCHSSSSTQLSNLFVGAREDHESVIRANCWRGSCWGCIYSGLWFLSQAYSPVIDGTIVELYLFKLSSPISTVN